MRSAKSTKQRATVAENTGFDYGAVADFLVDTLQIAARNP
jgi:hypothetical protein